MGGREALSLGAILNRLDLQTDEDLADVIESDGRLSLQLNKSVDLDRHLNAFGDLAECTEELNAAIDMPLRAEAYGGHDDDQAIQQLIDAHPKLAWPIRKLAALSNAVWNTNRLKMHVEVPYNVNCRTLAALPPAPNHIATIY